MKKSLLILLCGGITAASTLTLTENFNNNQINNALSAPSSWAFGGNASHSSNDRSYIQTVASDFHSSDFTAEITIILSGGGGAGGAFFGIGSGVADSNYYNEPEAGVYARIFPSDFSSGIASALADTGIRGSASPSFSPLSINTTGDGTHRLQLTKFGDSLSIQLDEDYDGTQFSSDYSALYSLSADAPFLDATNSHIFFGTGNSTTRFDDLTISTSNPTFLASANASASAVPEPSSLLLITSVLIGSLLTRRRKP